jgi:hypothetical protein
MSDRNSNRIVSDDEDVRPTEKKRKIIKERRRFNEFSIVDFKSGHLVKHVPIKGSVVYCDAEQLWLRSKVPMTPMSYDKARGMVNKFIEEDQENQRYWRG